MSSQGALLSCQLPTLPVYYLSGTWLLCHPYGIPVANHQLCEPGHSSLL